MENRYLEADLLIIGGGSAGCLAANRALEINPDLKVVVFEKGDMKYSGSIARGMDALNIVSIPNFTTPEFYVEVATEACAGVLDATPTFLMAKRSFELLKKLEGWGVHFPLDKSGHYRTLQYHHKGKFLVSMQEPDLKVMIFQRAVEKGTMPINRVMGIHLLLDDGRAAGAVGLNVRTGELVICRANAVILTAGGQARFSLPNSGNLYGTFDYPGNTGDGYVMAFRAGAKLTGMECSVTPMLIKDANIPLLAIALTRGGRLLDIFDEIVMEGQMHDMERMNQAIKGGHGPLRIRLSHLDGEVIDEIEEILFSTERPVQERFFKGRRIDFRKSDIELWPTEAQLCGGHSMAGVMVDQKMETGVPGLYVAGDVACVPKQHLTGAFVFGEVAAEAAHQFLSTQPKTKLDDGQIRKVETQRNKRLSPAGKEIDVRELEYKVRRLITDYVLSPKSAYKLGRWLEWSEQFRGEIESQILVRNGHDLSKLYEVENIVHCADFSAQASLERKESRWGQLHRRVDYPKKDDENWLRHVVLEKGSGSTEIEVGTRPVDYVIHDQ